MFVVSISSNKIKKAVLCLTLVAVVISGIAVVLYNCRKSDVGSNNLSVNNSASDIEEILKFISDFGWDVNNEPDEIREIIIPAEFDEVYNKYNEIQLFQGYDLSKYAGERAKNWTFTVRNYPGFEGEEFIKINILIYNNTVIGGDVCSIKIDGFMHGFSKD